MGYVSRHFFKWFRLTLILIMMESNYIMGSETLLTCNLHGILFAVLSDNISVTLVGSKNDHL